MGWFLMGIAIGWLISGLYWYNQTSDDKAGTGASIVGFSLFIIAVIVGINIGIASGAIPVKGMQTPTPLLGR